MRPTQIDHLPNGLKNMRPTQIMKPTIVPTEIEPVDRLKPYFLLSSSFTFPTISDMIHTSYKQYLSKTLKPMFVPAVGMFN